MKKLIIFLLISGLMLSGCVSETKTKSTLEKDVLNNFPEAIVLDKGDNFVPFRGGASFWNQSYHYVKFKLPDLSTLTPSPTAQGMELSLTSIPSEQKVN